MRRYLASWGGYTVLCSGELVAVCGFPDARCGNVSVRFGFARPTGVSFVCVRVFRVRVSAGPRLHSDMNVLSPPSLLAQVRGAMRLRRYSRRTEDTYVAWIRRYVRFSGMRHPRELGPSDVTRFLSSLAVDSHVSASTQNQALSAILFLYRHVLGQDVGRVEGVVRARTTPRLPVVLTRAEVAAVLDRLPPTPWLVAALLYGAGLRVLEALELRVKDVDIARGELTVRQGKGRKDRVAALPQRVAARLPAHLESVQRPHGHELGRGFGAVQLPDALARKHPNVLAFRSGPPVTHSGTRSPPTSWRTDTTSARCRSCWGIAMSAPRRSTRMF